jgi:alkylation response protein AidB-like acyl-CoA dehydrogenase
MFAEVHIVAVAAECLSVKWANVDRAFFDFFEDARVAADALLGEEGQGFRFAMAWLDGGRLNIGACSLGGAQRALDIALAYVKERRAFGQAVEKFHADERVKAIIAQQA